MCSATRAGTRDRRSAWPRSHAGVRSRSRSRSRSDERGRMRPGVDVSQRIVVIGGGSYQWVPKLLVDIANTPSLVDAEIVLHDIDPASLPRMAEWGEHIAFTRSIPLSVRTTTDRPDALTDADFVVVTISTGGFASMRHDLEVPRRFGIAQSVGDTVGPGGIARALRNIPVFLDIAHDMTARCPDAWMLNITNPMTTI